MIGRSAMSGGRLRVRPSPSPSPIRWYASTPSKPRKDLPPPLPPKKGAPQSPPVSPAKAKKDYLEARKKTGEFLEDPQAKIARLQADMEKTKEKLLRVHDKPIWKRIVDRLRAKQHAVINLLAASMAYLLAHRLHLKMKANEELQQRIQEEASKNSQLRNLLRSLTTEEFARDVVKQATTTKTTEQEETAAASAGWFGSSRRESSSSSPLPQMDALTNSLRQALEAKIGDEGLEDTDRKQKNIRDIWEENEQKLESTEEDLAELAAAIAAEKPTDASNSKKRVFDM